ncbi:hypothetical protein [Flavihumibacter fluvii]|uniref:hypothetical protein n=1 Tax=Flavihumibacter fluvii TaxID=2838157 RepID=UPI001BDEF137|nr:hypothetical protein [Flavihumibacter fluvii]ULQ52645.1 hypothetical protein KJS93_21385 [Flavihumibacter fluvii]
MILRKWIKWGLLTLSALILILTLSIGLWVRLRTLAAVQELVVTLSDGQYGLKANKIRVDPFNMQATAQKIYIYPLHTGNTNNEFELKADSLSLELTEVLQLLFQKKLNVKSFSVVNPTLELRVYEKIDHGKKIPVPLHQQVANIQTVFFKVLESLKVNRFELKNGSIAYYPELNQTQGRYFLNNINLAINNLHLLEKFTSGRLQNKATIHLELVDPVIEYPDSTIRIDLKHFDWDTRKRHFDITGLGFHKSIVAKGDSSGFQLQDIQLDSMNWNKLLTQGVVEMGELSASKGYFSSNDFNFKKKNKDSVKLEKNGNLLDIIGPILIKRLYIREIEFTGNTHTSRGKETISISGDQFDVTGLVIDKDLPNKIQLADLNLKVKAFLETDSSRTFRAGFGEISIRNNNLHLKDYYLHSLAKSRFGENKIDVQEVELTDLSISDLLNGKLKARELILIDPTVKILLAAGKKKTKTINWEKLQFKLNKKLDIGLIRINNAHLTVNQENNPATIARADSFYAIIASRNILRSQSLEQLFASDNSFSMPKLAIHLPNIHIDLVNAEYSDNNLSASSAKGATKNGNLSFTFNKVTAQDVNMPNILNEKDSGLLRLLSIGNGEVFITVPEEKPGGSNQSMSQVVRTIHTGPIKFSVKAKTWNLQAKMDSIYIEQLRKDPSSWVWQEYLLKGSDLIIDHPSIKGQAGYFTLGNGLQNSIGNSHFSADLPKLKLDAYIPHMDISQHIHSSLNATDAIETVSFKDPIIDVVLKKTSESQTASTKPVKKEIPGISFQNPTISISIEKADSLHKIASAKGGQLAIDPMTIEQGVITTNGLKLDLNNIISNQEKYDVRVPFLKLHTGKLRISKDEPIRTNIQALNIQEGQFSWHDSTKQILVKGINSKLDKSFRFNSSTDSLKRLLTTLPHLSLNTKELLYEKSGRQLVVHQLKVTSDKKQISFDSLHWVGTISRDSFFKASKVQKDFIQLHIGEGILNGYEMVDRGLDTVWTINQFNLSNMDALLERDKRYPMDSIQFRPLMTGMLQELQLKFALERIVLANSSLRYNEISEKKGKEGSIWFTDIGAIIRNVRNYDLNDTDSLSISARAKLMGKGNIRLTFRESYTDSLRGFIMLARMGKMELNALSPLLLPLFNIKIDRGRADSLWLNVKANDYLAYGKMEMDYRKLKLSLLNDAGKKKGFTSFLINTVLRSNNDKTGMVYRERIRNKSMFNYWGKIAMSGLLTNMGVQKNKKQVKKYQKEMKNLNLPPDLLLENE